MRGENISERQQFLCPGEQQAVTAAVHRARLSAGWSVCDGCEWRLHTEGLSERTAAEAELIREQRAGGIERTEFGVRGMWLNALTPAAAGLLAQAFSLSLVERWQQREERAAGRWSGQGVASTGDSGMLAERAAIPELLLGFDARVFSSEVFAGVVAAVRELGVGVLDAGRCTSASLQELLRCNPRVAGALFVTGAGAPAGWSGLDATDASGDGVQVVWRDVGVVLRVVGGGGGGQRLSLELSGVDLGVLRGRRLSRSAGRYESLDFEPRYRDWLRGWNHGAGSGSRRLLAGTDDPLVKQRLQWLAEHCGWSVAVSSVAEARRAESGLSLEVLEDDRWFVLRQCGGERIAAEKLALWLNTAVAGSSRSSQLTAHADSVTGRLWFTDSARPGNAGLTERIEDALAAAGILLGAGGLSALQQSGNLPWNRSSPQRGAC